MSIIANRSGNDLFVRQFPEFTEMVVDYLDRQSIMTTATVCKDWQNHPNLQKARCVERSARCGEECAQKCAEIVQYPREIRQTLRNSHLSILHIPVLNLQPIWEAYVIKRSAESRNPLTDQQIRERQNHIPDYIDFLKPVDLSHSVMRFQESGRSGIAFTIREKSGEKREQVLVFFKRYPDLTRNWMYTGLDHGNIEVLRDLNLKGIWSARNMENNRPVFQQIEQIILGTHPTLELAPQKESNSITMVISALAAATLSVAGYWIGTILLTD